MKKLALLLTLCLVATLLPGIGYSEEEVTGGALDLSPDASLSSEGILIEGLPEGDDGQILDGGELILEMDEPILEVAGETEAPGDESGEGETPTEGEVQPQEDELVLETNEYGEYGEYGDEPHVDPDGPQLAAYERTMGIGEVFALKASMPDPEDGPISYFSSDSSIARVSESGKIYAKAEGFACITASAESGPYSECFVTVKKAPEKISFNVKKLTIGKGESYKRLEVYLGDPADEYAGAYTLKSLNRKTAKVSKNSVVKGVKVGKAKLSVETYNHKKAYLDVTVKKAPGRITVSVDKKTLSVGEKGKVSYKLPKNTASAVTFTSNDPDIVRVDSVTGEITGVSAGKTRIYAATFNKKKAYVTVKVEGSAPSVEWVTFREDPVEIGVDQKRQLEVELNPGGESPLTFESADSDIARVSTDGVVEGVSAGETTVTVFTNVEGVTAQTTVKVLPAPDSVSFGVDETELNVGQSTILVPEIPSGTATGFTYSSSNPAVAAVDDDGTLTAVAMGEATVTVTTSNGKQASLDVTVTDPLFPKSARLTNAPDTMKAGEKLQLEWSVSPSGARVDFTWETSNGDIAYVDGEGVLHAVDVGYATITAVSQRNPKIVLTFKVTVESESAVLAIPARITGTSGIAGNLEMIDAIRRSAIGQIDKLLESGKITSADASKRRNIINNAFGDYAFPWMTLKKQLYWKKANSEGGAKDFKPNKVYYGVPYISGGGDHREYNVKKLLAEDIYYDSGKGYYILNQKKISGRKYYGNDCSCFVDAAIWGINSSHSDDRTKDIAKSSAYKTISGYDNMRTGDLICKGGHHVVMFLYYANAEKTKIMIIENGGIEPATNTVHCMVMNVSWYKSRGYRVRRLKSLG